MGLGLSAFRVLGSSGFGPLVKGCTVLFRDFGVWVWDFALVIYTISSDKSSIGFGVGALGFDIRFPVSGALEVFRKRSGL